MTKNANSVVLQQHTDLSSIDLKQAERFLQALGKNGSTCYRAFSHKTTPIHKKKARRLGKAQIFQAQKEGLGIYYVVNDGGDKKAEITSCIAYFAEFDGLSEVKQWEKVRKSGLPEPSFVVATGGGSLHFYWLLVEPEKNTAQWQDDMKRLAAHLDSDPSINDPSRVMRLPGCLYMDGNGQPVAQVQIVHESADRFTREQIIGCLPEREREPAKQQTAALSQIDAADCNIQRALDQLKRIPARIPGSNTRDTYLKLFWGLVYILGAEQAVQAMEAHSPAWAAADDLRKIAADANGSITAGTFFEIAKRDFNISSPRKTQVVITPQVEVAKARSLDQLLGPATENKLRCPRSDALTKVVELVMPLRFNLLTQRIENDGEPIDGDFLGTLYLHLAEQHQLSISKDRAADAALLVARRNSYHPVRDYLNSGLPQLHPLDWDEIAFKCFGVSDQSCQLHLQRQLIGLVARAMDPGCKLDTSLVIQSPKQGIGKSTMWAILGGKWFSDSLGDLRNLKDDVLQLHSAWIHEWGEIDAIVGKRESETLKKFLSACKDDVRKPYGRGVETLFRSCGIVGTTNRSDFIKDPTGNRRFPVISVDRVEIDWIANNRDAIWGAALAAFKAGEVWHYDNAENAAITKEAQNYSAEDPLRDQIETWMEDNPNAGSIAMPVLIYRLNPERQRDQEFSRQVSLRLTALGWTKSKKRERGCLPDGEQHDKATVWTAPVKTGTAP